MTFLCFATNTRILFSQMLKHCHELQSTWIKYLWIFRFASNLSNTMKSRCNVNEISKCFNITHATYRKTLLHMFTLFKWNVSKLLRAFSGLFQTKSQNISHNTRNCVHFCERPNTLDGTTNFGCNPAIELKWKIRVARANAVYRFAILLRQRGRQGCSITIFRRHRVSPFIPDFRNSLLYTVCYPIPSERQSSRARQLFCSPLERERKRHWANRHSGYTCNICIYPIYIIYRHLSIYIVYT